MMAELLAQDEVTGCKDHMQVMKGKRAKRQRPLSPLALAMVSSCSSEGERFSDNISGLDRAMAASPTTSIELTTTTEEEEDMANCLILLARGHTNKKLSSVDNHQPATANNNNNSNNYYSATTGSKAAAATGLDVYQCKSCNRCFPSFQALGGHRASHKKPKLVNEERKALTLMEEEDDHFSYMSTTLSLKIANTANNLCASNKGNKVHECSICGAEFSSGQALGGHMRRHRPFMGTTKTITTPPTAVFSNFGQSQEAKKAPRNILQLDLNLPAPEDDRRESVFTFASQEQVIVFSASSLVDCHY